MRKKLHNLILLAKICQVAAWLGLIMVLMIEPLPVVESGPQNLTVLDKLLHLFLFGVLSWLLLAVWQEWRAKVTKQNCIAVAVVAVSLAGFMEYWQHFIPGRNAAWLDLISGFVGSVTAVVIFWRYRLREQQLKIKHKPGLLLHLCCGPCGAQISEDLQKDYAVTLLFANSNLDSLKEYKKRLLAAKILAKRHGLPLIVEAYKHDEWSLLIKGLEDEPERGKRCLLCYRYRLAQTAAKCRDLGLDYYASSLAVSPYKNVQAVINIGRALSLKSGPKFLDKNFNANDGFRQSVAAAKRLGLYRQKYCGCEFSRRDKK